MTEFSEGSSRRSDRTGPDHSRRDDGGRHSPPSLPLGVFYEQLDGAGPPYDVRPYTAKGRITLLSAPPKQGKSTFAALYAHAKASGGPFLGQYLDRGNALYVAPDENWRDVARRFRSFGTPEEDVQLWRRRNCTVDSIARRAAEIEADLVVLDTLLRVAGISDENDNAEWDRWFGEARGLIADSNAVWFALHHDRKSGGQDGKGIRGASVIFGAVDVAISLQSSEESPQRRVLQVEGTRLDDAEPLVIELNTDQARYEAVGEAEIVSILEDRALERLRGVLTDEPRPVSEIDETLREHYPETEGDVAEATIRNRLEKLVSTGGVQRSGEGGRRDPYKYSLDRSRGGEEKSRRDGERADGHDASVSEEGRPESSDSSRSIAQQPKGSERLSAPADDSESGSETGPAVVDPTAADTEEKRF